MPDWKPEEASRTLAPGDVFVMYTDGIIETVNHSEELYGEKRLVDLVQSIAGKPAKEIISVVLDDVARFGHNEPLKDDATLMILRIV
jgi:sigma-B regulation protein RsbU (phosphoserine phosphatase)